ncbi:MAG: alpha/beta hydrolase [Acidobacteria bacterium]|nr:alpha/beta hydrolase [Acidobacteriota bacterium]
MLKMMTVLVVSGVLTAFAPAGPPEPAALPTPPGGGSLVRYAAFPSAFVAARNVDVWLPPGYDPKGADRYPVLYLHDGQNLFDPKTSYTGVPWGVDEALARLAREGAARPAIVVGVWNTARRVAEYMPQKAAAVRNTGQLTGIPRPTADDLASDAYLKFLVSELKPFIDGHYRTRPGPADTLIMGSSMGGLISVYALCEYPGVFGAAGCLSTHWPAGDGVVIEWLKTHLPDPGTHRVYFDYGTATLDASYEPYQQRMDEVMRMAGYTEGKNWVTRKFPGAEHNEKAWRARLDVPLRFLLGAGGGVR